MVWAMNWFMYDPTTRLVHQEQRCITHWPEAQRRGIQRVGHSSFATLDDAVQVARDTLDPEAQPCQRCQRLFAADRGISDSEWREMLGNR